MAAPLAVLAPDLLPLVEAAAAAAAVTVAVLVDLVVAPAADWLPAAFFFVLTADSVALPSATLVFAALTAEYPTADATAAVVGREVGRVGDAEGAGDDSDVRTRAESADGGFATALVDAAVVVAETALAEVAPEAEAEAEAEEEEGRAADTGRRGVGDKDKDDDDDAPGLPLLLLRLVPLLLLLMLLCALRAAETAAACAIAAAADADTPESLRTADGCDLGRGRVAASVLDVKDAVVTDGDADADGEFNSDSSAAADEERPGAAASTFGATPVAVSTTTNDVEATA